LDKNVNLLLNVGDSIELEISKKDLSYLSMKSQVVSTISNNIVVVTAPIYKGNIYPLSISEVLNVTFSKENTGKYSFLGQVIKREKSKNLVQIHIKKIGELKKIQKREFFRLNIILNVKIKYTDDQGKSQIVEGIARDISGGGIRLIAKTKLSKDSIVSVGLALDDNFVEVDGKIVRCIQFEESLHKYDIGVKFLDMDEGTRGKIISYIFKKQRKIIKKGLI